MDKKSDESMAPALHSTEHNQASAKIKYHLCLPPDSIRADLAENQTIYEQMNGVREGESTEGAKTSSGTEGKTNPMRERTNHVNSVDDPNIVASNCLLNVQSNGGSGDYMSSLALLQQDIKKRALLEKAKTIRDHDNEHGTGDGLHKNNKTNGWSLKEATSSINPAEQLASTKSNLTNNDSVPIQESVGSPEVQHASSSFDSGTSSVSNNNSRATAQKADESVVVGHKPCLNSNEILTDIQDKTNSTKHCDLTSETCLNGSCDEPLSKDSKAELNLGVPKTLCNSNGLTSSSGNLPNTVSEQAVSLINHDTTAILPSRSEVPPVSDSISLVVRTVLSKICDSVVRINKTSGRSSNNNQYVNSDPNSDPEMDERPADSPPTAPSASNLNLPNASGIAHGLISSTHIKNLPQNLTNTLLELAASLASSQNMPENGDPKSATSFLNGHRHASAKSLNFEDNPPKVYEVSRISNAEAIRSQHALQFLDVKSRHCLLNKQIASLTRRLNKIRNIALTTKATGHLKLVAQHFHPHEINSKTELEKSAKSTFWREDFSGKLPELDSGKLTSEDLNSGLISVDGNTYNESHVLADQEKQSKVMQKKAKTKLGILRKEVRFVQSLCDPDLTDESSDEDSPELVYKSGEGFVPCKRKAKHSSPQDQQTGETAQSRLRQAQQTWLKQRLQVAKRWTWLQAQVSDLEFKIRTHNEIYRQIRSNKSEVILGQPPQPNSSTSTPSGNTTTAQLPPVISHFSSPMSTSTNTSPLNISKMMQNVNRQTTNLLDNLSPLSVGTPSPHSAQSESRTENSNRGDNSTSHSDATCIAARTRPLQYPVRQRRIVNAKSLCRIYSKSIRPPTFSHEGSLVSNRFHTHSPFHRADGRLLEAPKSKDLQCRASQHDHSYHRILSTEEDVPLSLRVNSFMKSSQKWYNDKLSKRERRLEKKNKRKSSKKSDSLAEKIKNRSRSATVVLERIKPFGGAGHNHQRLHSSESYHGEASSKRRGSIQTMNDYHKRSRMNSMDSDADSTHVRSGATTPTTDGHSNPQMQAFLRRKRQSDHAYDINNIVIPHGLSTTRIEKLQYKEILTPGWRTAGAEKAPEISTKKAETAAPSDVTSIEGEEDLTDAEFRTRHDRYEITEKKKYMAYMEWSIHKKNGTRSISRANMPPKIEAAVNNAAASSSAMLQCPQSLRSSPVSAPVTSPDPAPGGSPVQSPERSLFTLPAGIRTRRSSSDQNRFASSNEPTQPSTTTTTTSTPTAAPNSRETPLSSPEERRVSPTSQRARYSGDWGATCWESRCFPLSDAAHEELMKPPVVPDPPKARAPHLTDAELESRFRPISRQSSVDTNTALKHSRSLPKHQGEPRKRQRTSSQLSSVSRDDERHSDCSISSTHSSKRHAHDSHLLSVVGTRAPHPKRHKSSLKDDFIFYADLCSDDSATETASDLDEALISAESSDKESWVTKPVALTPQSHNSDSLPQKEPLLLKIKRSK